ncbi:MULTISPECIES: SHOCT domain-containing protein [unclassified Nocardiopsis]|uniref:SHOCT domain-containing protein n=1 Tax=unclassified Nocardiopsis TaxID=2649073 RepID=UPI00135957C0|nr:MULTISPECIES: SHOCT domain-containing protein [unclassified Nocardiopsis]
MGYVMATVMILIMVSLGVFVVVTIASVGGAVRSERQRSATDSPERRGVDAAQEELRIRYARGEIDREEFLQRKIDLEP